MTPCPLAPAPSPGAALPDNELALMAALLMQSRQTILPKRLGDATGVPYVTINGDLNDLRLYSEEQTRTQFEALVEQLPGRR